MAEEPNNGDVVFFNFQLDVPHVSNQEAVRLLAALRWKDLNNPGQFNITIAAPIANDVLDELLLTFYYFQNNGIEWQSLMLYFADNNIDFRRLSVALEVANRASLFQQICIHLEDGVLFENPRRLVLLPSLELNKRLKQLSLQRSPYDESNNNTFLSHPQDIASLASALQDPTSLLRTLHLDSTNIGQPDLLAALASNQTLEDVTLTTEVRASAPDLLHSLAQHRSLESLDIRIDGIAEGEFQQATSNGFAALLTSNVCRVQKLTVRPATADFEPIDPENLFQGLGTSNHLKYLCVRCHFVGENPFSCFLRALVSHPKLEKVQLLGSIRFTREDIQEARACPRLQQCVEIDHWFQANDQEEEALAGLLFDHPEIFLKLGRNEFQSEDLLVMNHMNRLGRHLWTRNNVPIKLLPLLLARIQNADHRHGLRGPVQIRATHSEMYQLLRHNFPHGLAQAASRQVGN
eukprot:CAMPEP_0113626354 /NCGR_PEP_ID=MMETSP0017_2-20120614/13628_1 /TAXON_ID=2856 /ORGANISM="Cylindrotheca closterium" /LENGTH=462 /DNA_ID=CAMNT_0000536529 /DNA_START=27 /DNA_END=1415 /DNA_ORIENTATION=- /assembly_acc=CAM_ASM_000147